LPYEGIILVTVFFIFSLVCVLTTVLRGWITLLAYVSVELSLGFLSG
jgi:hypothetical protein